MSDPASPGDDKTREPLPARDGVYVLGAAALILLPAWGASWGPSPAPAVAGRIQPLPPIDIRSAPWHEWTLLEGIGEARARRIVEHRARCGGFRSLADLERVSGLPEGWVARVAPQLSCGSAAP